MPSLKPFSFPPPLFSVGNAQFPHPSLVPPARPPVTPTEEPKPALYRNIRATVVIHTVLLILLSVAIVVLFVTRSSNNSNNINIETRSQGSSSIHFLLVPSPSEEQSLAGWMRIPLQIDISQVADFSVCCRIENQLVCGKQRKDLGVSAYLTADPAALIQIVHPRMVGASCRLTWRLAQS
jgi:hypothetical protein